MGINAKIEQCFPGVGWTGGSNIHKSVYKELALPEGAAEAVFSALKDNNVPNMIWEFLQERLS